MYVPAASGARISSGVAGSEGDEVGGPVSCAGDVLGDGAVGELGDCPAVLEESALEPPCKRAPKKAIIPKPNNTATARIA